MGDAQRAFENAQKRNQELERILDELESRMRQVEEQKVLSASDANASSFVELSVTPASPSAGTPTTFAEPTNLLSPTPNVIEKPASSAATPVTTLPEPPKRRKFFPFLRKSKEPAPQLARAEANSIAPVSGEFLTPKELQGATISQVSEVSMGKPETSKPAVVTPRRADQTIAGGNVLLVNRNYNFIVINLGSKQGISLDDVLSVQHEGAEIAKVRVEKLYDDYSAAYIVEEQSQHPIGEGDGVTAA